MTSTLAKGFICEKCVKAIKGIAEPAEGFTFYDQVEPVTSFCFLGDRLNTHGGSEAAVTARTKIGWMKFREGGELYNERNLSLKIKHKFMGVA